MKYLIITFLLLSACISNSTRQNVLELNYNTISHLNVGSTTEAEAVTALGIPSSRVEKNGYYILNYYTLKTDVQRLSLNFDSSTKKLASMLWIPMEGEQEISLAGAKARFSKGAFKSFDEDTSSPHAISKITLYTNEDAGVSIRYNPTTELVEAIAKYDIPAREPATNQPKKSIPYTFGDQISN